MKTLPEGLVAYSATRVFDQDSIPAGLLKQHSTKEGVWGQIIVSHGQLLYRIPSQEEEVTLSPSLPGVVEPQVLHEVQPLGKVSFHVQFYRAPK